MKSVYDSTLLLILILIISLTIALVGTGNFTTVYAQNLSLIYSSKEIKTPKIFLTYNTPQINQEEAKEAKETREVSITISAAGDVTLGTDENFSQSGSFIAEYENNHNDPDYFFKNVYEIFSKDDLTIVNLEAPLTNAKAKANKKFRFKGYPEFTEILTAGSVEAVNLANNHTFDYLEQGYRDTVENLQKAEIGFFGYEYSYLKEIKGIGVGLLGYKGWSIGQEVKKQIKQDIDKLKAQGAKLVIVSFHWGDERSNYPNYVQQDLGRFTLDSGANLVLGHHPHVIQGIENYKDKIIVYSLANFCFGGNRNPPDKDTFIFQQTFKFLGEELIDKTQIDIIPASVSSVTYRNNYQPTPAEGKEKERILGRINKYSSNLNFSQK